MRSRAGHYGSVVEVPATLLSENPHANIIHLVRLTSERWRFLQGCFQTWRSIWIALVVIGYWLTYHDRRYPHATIGSALLIIGVGMGVLHVEHMTHVQWQL